MTTKPLTPAELGEIRERAEKATQGEWTPGTSAKGAAAVWTAISVTGSMQVAETGYAEFDHDNANFIAHSREDLPRLLAEVDRLKVERDAAYSKGLRDGRTPTCSHCEQPVSRQGFVHAECAESNETNLNEAGEQAK